MNYSCITDIGLIREKNQDSYITIKNKYGDLLAIVADGIGGGNAGEVASSEVVKYFKKEFIESGPFDSLTDQKEYMNYHISKANKIVFDKSIKSIEYRGMGTTITGILITSKGTISFNCGDSRVYGFIDNKMIQLTSDHTLVNQMLQKGQITYEESLNHPKKHYLVKAIGIFENINVDINQIKDMDYYLICSDGLHSYVEDKDILEIVYDENKSIKDKVNDLKDKALLQGGYDNVTIILVKK